MINKERFHKAVLIFLIAISPLLFIKGCGSYYSEADKEDKAHYFEYKIGSMPGDVIKGSISKLIYDDTLISNKKVSMDSLNSSYIIEGSSKIKPVELGIGDAGFITVSKVNFTLIIKIKSNLLTFTYTNVKPVIENDYEEHSYIYDSSELHRNAQIFFEMDFKSITGQIKK